MKKATFIKLLCLALACLMLLPMVIACGEEEGGDGAAATTGGSTQGTTDSSNGAGNEEKIQIVFRLDGGEIVNGSNSIKIVKGSKLTATPEVVKTGFVFDYWSYSANGNDPWEADHVFNIDTVLYANWKAAVPGGDTTNSSNPGTTPSNPGTTPSNPGTTPSNPGSGDGETGKVGIAFDANGGSVVFDYIEIEKGGKLSYANVPTATRAGYTHKGWSYDPFGNEMWSARNDTFTDDETTLYAIWEKEGGTTDPSTKPSEPSTGKVGIVFDGNGGSVVFDYIEIDSGAKLAYSNVPTATRAGYTLKGWAYDPFGNEMWSARNDTFTDSETTLYAVWEKDGGSTTPSNPGTGDSSNPGTTPDVPGDKVLVEYDTGTGYFENDSDYEVEISVGSRIPAFPTPIHDDPSMQFDGWYMDPDFTTVASRSTKIYEDTTIYAKWKQQVECSDGSYDHVWGSWDQDTKPSCSKPGIDARYCSYCGNKDTKEGDPALGHLWNSWEEAFMRRERACGRLGCTEKEIINYTDVTISVLGSAPGGQLEGSTDKFYDVPFTNLINGRWDEGFGEFVGPRGNGTAYVQFNLVEATAIDRIYFKGEGVTSINVFVQYAGESDFVLIGVCGAAPDKESSPFVSPDASKKIVAVKFVEDTPPQGTSKWQEVAFVKVATEE